MGLKKFLMLKTHYALLQLPKLKYVCAAHWIASNFRTFPGGDRNTPCVESRPAYFTEL